MRMHTGRAFDGFHFNSTRLAKLQFNSLPINRRLPFSLRNQHDRDAHELFCRHPNRQPGSIRPDHSTNAGLRTSCCFAPTLGILSAICGGLFEIEPGSS